ncbi:MAG TPA: efflux RND transporter periplasmic adaptor subunit [Chitinophagaceae bacterium]|nr:efflux RND transporter periplasmic adaptor subunit [Chitinophagaceae bacterium]HNU13521.1 efflux RND transporter periplasmic adaptor subunit [Chitinophagaceae bacterium]
MNNILKISFAAIIAVTLIACGAGAKDKKGAIGDIKAKLEKLKKEKSTLDADIRKLEEELAKADPSAAKQVAKLVAVDTLRVQDFVHYIELQGKISSNGIGYVAPKGGGGLIRAIYVKVGQKVGVGQLVLKLDDAMQRQSLIAAQQATGQLKARLAQAQTIYERYQNLWKQNIGAEINVINAKADVDALAAQLRSAEAQAAQAGEALDMTNVRAGLSGVVEQVNVRVGEFFTGATQQGGQIVIVNASSLKAEVPVPDNYVAKVKKGDKVLVSVPETGKAPFESAISVVGAAIDPTTRSFLVEAKLPSDALLKPNQTATMKILDYEAKATIAVPINVVQSDEKGKYVYVMEKAGEKMVARKKTVNVGEAYNGLMEIKSGLTGGEVIITEGYQTVYDGQSITTGK